MMIGGVQPRGITYKHPHSTKHTPGLPDAEAVRVSLCSACIDSRIVDCISASAPSILL